MEEENTKQNVTCPHCFNYIEVNKGDELFICPVCGRSFTDEDILVYLDSIQEE